MCSHSTATVPEDSKIKLEYACRPEAGRGFSELTLSLTQNTGPLENTRWRAARNLARARGDGPTEEIGDGAASPSETSAV